MKKFVKVPLVEFLQLENDSNELYYLESCGVDNWEPGITREEFEDEYNIKLDVSKDDIIYEIIEE